MNGGKMDDRFTPRPVAAWFMTGAVASLLFMALGCAALAMHLAADPAKLPLDQRALLEAEPMWVLVASGIGFVAGTIGALLLVLRRKAAEPMLLVALLALFVWLAGMFATSGFRDLLSTAQIALLLVVVALAWTIYWFARHSRQRGWLD
jgi:Na+/proline symporter